MVILNFLKEKCFLINYGKKSFFWKTIFRKSVWTVLEMTDKKSSTIFLCVHNR